MADVEKAVRPPRRLVLIESPYAGDIPLNTRYARAALGDCIHRGESPFASHMLYTQPGVLNDLVPAERDIGMRAGWEWLRVVECVVVYQDLGITPGMKGGITRATKRGVPVEYRNIADWK